MSDVSRTNRNMGNWKKFLRKCFAKILFPDTEQLSEMWISSQVFFKDFVLIDSKVPALKTDFYEGIFKVFCRNISE